MAAHFWHCEGCGAHAPSESTLRKIVQPKVWAAIWPAIRKRALVGSCACPMCGRPMEETCDVSEAGELRVDYGEVCGVVWLDPGELAGMPKVPVVERVEERTGSCAEESVPRGQSRAAARTEGSSWNLRRPAGREGRTRMLRYHASMPTDFAPRLEQLRNRVRQAQGSL